MPQLLISGDINFAISEVNENGIITASMYNNITGPDSIFVNVELDKKDIIAIGEWLLKEARKLNKSEAP